MLSLGDKLVFILMNAMKVLQFPRSKVAFQEETTSTYMCVYIYIYIYIILTSDRLGIIISIKETTVLRRPLSGLLKISQ